MELGEKTQWLSLHSLLKFVFQEPRKDACVTIKTMYCVFKV
jgi:hypothetical protein